ncbi:PREDICTED: TFIIA-alpha and beta-like factor isoform X2 [Chrysochloris asiatica]|uniref:TFIIA-alpha and beta-like factor isoform X2 n=1 Tax=Chrysochloris asiatica TaxID=185453 RepID=A0A9B0WK46_CHRAS|nr:PREDICTED: TFIIA-alpha and beta-like factor isoform X2 [Chrysochloris asiatica]
MALVNPVLWETKVLQSKATEDFFRNNVHSPLFTLQLPHGLHQTLQTSTATLFIPSGRTVPSFTTELGTSKSSANFTFPSSVGYPVHVPAGVTLQTASGHLYKVNVPVIVTQTPGRANILQHPIQHIFQQLGQPAVIQTSVPRLSPASLHATTEKSQRLETVFQQPTILHSGTVDRKHTGNEHNVMSEVLLSQQESPQYISLPNVVFAPQVSQTDSNVEPVLSVSASMTPNMHGGPFSMGPQGALHQQHIPDVQLHVLNNRMYGCDSAKQPRNIEEPSSLPVSKKDSDSQVNLNGPDTDDDINEIIQIDGTGDTSSNEEIGITRDVDEHEFLGIIDAEDLKLLEEESDSVSNEESNVNSSDNEDPRRDIIEEDPLNSGDDVSEQDVPDLFDTENVIVCQYDKIHRNKNKWKFYLKDGVMCFGGKDYVFAKAIGDAEW